jgi:hypothetical protein
MEGWKVGWDPLLVIFFFTKIASFAKVGILLLSLCYGHGPLSLSTPIPQSPRLALSHQALCHPIPCAQN